MKTFYKVCKIVFLVSIINIALLFIIEPIIGGNALNGKIEGSHYYFSNNGQFTEVNYFVFWFSELQNYSVCISVVLIIITNLIFKITGGGVNLSRLTSITVTTPQTTDNALVTFIHSLFRSMVDLFWSINWIVLDSWRKPDCEFFVRFPKQECIKELQVASDDKDPSIYNLEKPLFGIFSNKYFCLQKWSYSPMVKDGGIRPVLSGKFYSTPHGTYIRMWHRFATEGIFFLTMLCSTVFSLLFLFLVVPIISSYNVQGSFDYLISSLELFAFPLFYLGTLLISIWIGSAVGKAKNRNIIEFVKTVLNF